MKNRLKICLIAPVPPPYGGIANWVRLISNFVDNKQEEIEIVKINTAPENRTTEGRTLWNRIINSGFAMLKQSGKLKKTIKTEKIDVIHITTSGQLAVIRDILFLINARSRHVPSIYHIRFGRIAEIAKRNSFEWILISKAMETATEVMTIDNTTLNAIKQYLPKVNVVMIPNPIDVASLPKKNESCSKTVIFLGWIVKTKGIEELLLAWNSTYKENTNWKLMLVGPCKVEYMRYLKEKYSFEGVIYKGEQEHSDAMNLLNESEIFILPSYTEGFPNSVLEAMALCKPVISTRVGAIPDMLADDCGILINSKSSEDIIKSLKLLIADAEYRQYISKNAYIKLNNEYDINIIFKRYIYEWEKLSKR